MRVLLWIVAAILSAALACSVFTNILIFKLLGIKDLESLKQTMLAKELLETLSSMDDDFCVD